MAYHSTPYEEMNHKELTNAFYRDKLITLELFNYLHDRLPGSQMWRREEPPSTLPSKEEAALAALTTTIDSLRLAIDHLDSRIEQLENNSTAGAGPL